MKIKTVGAILFGFALSYIPNNFLSEKYEDLAFYIVIGLAIIGVIWSIYSNRKHQENYQNPT